MQHLLTKSKVHANAKKLKLQIIFELIVTQKA